MPDPPACRSSRPPADVSGSPTARSRLGTPPRATTGQVAAFAIRYSVVRLDGAAAATRARSAPAPSTLDSTNRALSTSPARPPITTSPPPCERGRSRLLENHFADAEQDRPSRPTPRPKPSASTAVRTGRIASDRTASRRIMRPRSAPLRIASRTRGARGQRRRCGSRSRCAVPSALTRSKSVGDLLAGPLVELARRLVREQQRRPVGERPRDRHALHLAARELRRPVVARGGEPDVLEQLARSAAARRPSATRPRPAAARRSPRPSASAAGRTAGTRSRSDAAECGCARLRRGRATSRPSNEQRAARRRVHAAEHVQQRRLAASRRPRDRHVISGRHAQRDVPHRLDRSGRHREHAAARPRRRRSTHRYTDLAPQRRRDRQRRRQPHRIERGDDRRGAEQARRAARRPAARTRRSAAARAAPACARRIRSSPTASAPPERQRQQRPRRRRAAPTPTAHRRDAPPREAEGPQRRDLAEPLVRPTPSAASSSAGTRTRAVVVEQHDRDLAEIREPVPVELLDELRRSSTRADPAAGARWPRPRRPCRPSARDATRTTSALVGSPARRERVRNPLDRGRHRAARRRSRR